MRLVDVTSENNQLQNKVNKHQEQVQEQQFIIENLELKYQSLKQQL